MMIVGSRDAEIMRLKQEKKKADAEAAAAAGKKWQTRFAETVWRRHQPNHHVFYTLFKLICVLFCSFQKNITLNAANDISDAFSFSGQAIHLQEILAWGPSMPRIAHEIINFFAAARWIFVLKSYFCQ